MTRTHLVMWFRCHFVMRPNYSQPFCPLHKILRLLIGIFLLLAVHVVLLNNLLNYNKPTEVEPGQANSSQSRFVRKLSDAATLQTCVKTCIYVFKLEVIIRYWSTFDFYQEVEMRWQQLMYGNFISAICKKKKFMISKSVLSSDKKF